MGGAVGDMGRRAAGTVGTISVAVISGVLTNAVWAMPWRHWSHTKGGKWTEGTALVLATMGLFAVLVLMAESRADRLRTQGRRSAAAGVWALAAVGLGAVGVGFAYAETWLFTGTFAVKWGTR